MWAVVIITTSSTLMRSLRMKSSSQQAAQMKTHSSEGNESTVRTAMPGALQMFSGWLSSLTWKNLRDYLAAAGG